MSKPRLLDLFCGGGGAAMGYHRAGFEVVGVDNRPQPHYPFEFHQGDALTFPLDGFGVIHASPPCQAFSPLRHVTGKAYPDLLMPIRQRLLAWGGVYVIENVPGAPLHAPIVLCGEMFGLRTYRHRLFEVPALLLACEQPYHPPHRTPVTGCNSEPKRQRWQEGWHLSVAGNFGPADMGAVALGIDWMRPEELAQAVPPAYTQWIGQQLIAALRWEVA